jgi:hypothetical protein
MNIPSALRMAFLFYLTCRGAEQDEARRRQGNWAEDGDSDWYADEE